MPANTHVDLKQLDSDPYREHVGVLFLYNVQSIRRIHVAAARHMNP